MAWCRGLNAAAGLRSLFALLLLLQFTKALQTVSGSPCQSVCADAGTLDDDAVCLDKEYKSTAGGRGFQKCVDCLLSSTSVDTGKNETDVQWGLFNLRFTLSTCMFGVPEERVSISSPCQVTCAPLNGSIGYQLTTDPSDANPKPDYCNHAEFDDTTINNCAFCYSFIPQQLFTANFLQALHIQCRDPPLPATPFFPDAQAIFNETLIAGPSSSSSNTHSSGLHGTTLALVIALPIVGGILLIGGSCWCCFLFTRRRRRRMAASGRMSRVQAAYADGNSHHGVLSAKGWGDDDLDKDMYQMSPQRQQQSYAQHYAAQQQQQTPSAAQARWSQHYPSHPSQHSAAAENEDGTPLRNSFQEGREDVGPGFDQVQDPDLHEQYFGVADGGEGLTPRSRGLGLSGSQRNSRFIDEGERGSWQ